MDTPAFNCNEPAAPIVLFDSGVGGLTVASALRRALPGEDLVYFGDTARVPYGIKSPEIIRVFARQNARFLMRYQPKLLVVACNTASATALHELAAASPMPVLGVIQPGARAAAAATRTLRVGVIGTESTVRSKVYSKTIAKLNPAITVFEKACPLFVPLVEEGRSAEDPLVYSIVREYLSFFFDKRVDCLVLGCTHYPVLKEVFSRIMGRRVVLIDSAEETAREVVSLLEARGLLNANTRGQSRYIVSDNPQRFRRTSATFLGKAPRDVESVDIAEFYREGSDLRIQP